MGTFGQLCNYESNMKYAGYMLHERRLREKKPADLSPVVRRTSHGSYVSTLMS